MLALLSSWGFFNLTRAEIGPMFVADLLIGFLAFAPIPFFAYRAYALLRADYYIDRDSLAMLWGLRVEDIPLTDIEWVRPASDLTSPLLLPRFRLPGAVLGTRRHPDLGRIEFIASSSRNLNIDRHIQTYLRHFATECCKPGPNICARHRNGKSDARRSEVYISVLPHHAGMGKFCRSLSLGERHPAQSWSHCLGWHTHPLVFTNPVWVQSIWRAKRNRIVHAINSSASGERVHVRYRTHSGPLFLSLGATASACVHRLGVKHALCIPFSHGSSIPRHYTNLNANYLWLHPRNHHRLSGISRPQSQQKRSICCDVCRYSCLWSGRVRVGNPAADILHYLIRLESCLQKTETRSQ